MALSNSEFNTLVSGIMSFITELGGLPLYSYQYVFARRIVESVLKNDGHTVTALWSRQTGKTTTVAIVAVGLAVILPVLARQYDGGTNEDGTVRPLIEELVPYQHGFWIGIFAPIAHQALFSYNKIRNILYSNVGQALLNDPEINVSLKVSRGDSLTLSHGSYIHSKTASPDSNIEGDTYHLVITDESQKLDKFKVEKEIEPMLSSTNGTMVKIGTAWVSRGGFQADIQWNIAQYNRKLAPRNHFEFPYDIIIAEKEEAYKRDGNKFHLNYKRYVEKHIRKRGKNSLAFRMNFMLKWQESNLDVFSAEALLDAQDTARHLNVYEASDLTRVAGIDVGKDNDPTVVTINEVDFAHPIVIRDAVTGETEEYFHKKFVAMREFEGTFEDRNGAKGQYSNVVEFVREWDTVRATIDATSIGDPVAERLQKLTPEIEWEFFKYSSPTKHKLFKTYIDEVESGRQLIAASDESRKTMEFLKWEEEHRSLEKHYTNSGYMDCRAPEAASSAARQIETESEYHDDYPNSSALACWSARAFVLAEVQTVAAGVAGGYSSGSRYGGRGSIRSRYARR